MLPALTGEARFHDRLIDGLDLTLVAAADLAHGQAQLALRIYFQSGSADRTGQSTDDVLPVGRSRPLGARRLVRFCIERKRFWSCCGHRSANAKFCALFTAPSTNHPHSHHSICGVTFIRVATSAERPPRPRACRRTALLINNFRKGW